MAADIVENGWADMVCMTRAHITDPAVVRKAQEGRKHETHICVGANECILRNFQQRDIFCMMNPVTGREAEWGEGKLGPCLRKSPRRSWSSAAARPA